MNEYRQQGYRLSHYQTSTHQEIDLILTRGSSNLLVEIKSTSSVDEVEVSKLKRLSSAFRGSKAYYVSQDPTRSEIHGVHCRHWKQFIQEIFNST